MGLLTKEEEKRFLKEPELLAVESSEGTEDKDNSRPRTVQVDVLPTREKTERRLAKRRKTRSVGSEEVSQPKFTKEVAKELTLSEAILKQIVAEVGVW
ncbi:hypothetical protein AXG93_1856s1030 [Marchantia polymorpha subsp. ruderalis]|uniref:Uncharacterized protein n=1 Tax=Marchantia polymorpha subsp. ruderalis TaxID=1480154 RepID=A0A176VRS9_MARPO|nr:hypothetical protein AXG93_1856s1030 [Marchantia polymorpha subsp. ruderalis]